MNRFPGNAQKEGRRFPVEEPAASADGGDGRIAEDVGASGVEPLCMRAVSKRFATHQVLDRISLELGYGKTILVLGANGAGKTTLLRIAAGVTHADSGSVEHFGKRVLDDDLPTRRRVSYVSQRAPMYRELTPLEHLTWWARLYGIDRVHERCESILQEARLARMANERCGSLSRGQQQRLAISMALLPSPDLLIMDEPEAALDDQGLTWLHTLLSERRGRVATIIAAHGAERLGSIADSRLIIEKGRGSVTA